MPEHLEEHGPDLYHFRGVQGSTAHQSHRIRDGPGVGVLEAAELVPPDQGALLNVDEEHGRRVGRDGYPDARELARRVQSLDGVLDVRAVDRLPDPELSDASNAFSGIAGLAPDDDAVDRHG